MALVMMNPERATPAQPSALQQEKDQASTVPEIIEERRSTSDGRVAVQKYARGKILGKVVHFLHKIR